MKDGSKYLDLLPFEEKDQAYNTKTSAPASGCSHPSILSNTMKTTWKSHHENDGLSKYGGRDCVGYGQTTPKPKFPNGAKVAVNFVINYEEGGEKCLLHGDTESEKLLTEIAGAEAYGTLDSSLCILFSLLESLLSELALHVVLVGLMHRLTRGCRALFFCLPKKYRGRTSSQYGELVRLRIACGVLEAASLVHVQEDPMYGVCGWYGTFVALAGHWKNFLIIISLRGGACLEIFAIAAE